MQTPEYNDAYVKEFTDYSTTKEYEEAIRELLTEEYEENGYSDTVEALFQAAIDASTFSGYPDELYDACKEEVLSLYGGFLGTSRRATKHLIFPRTMWKQKYSPWLTAA